MKLEEPMNKGYQATRLYMDMIHGLESRITDIKEIYPDKESYGGLKFSFTHRETLSRFKVVLNYNDFFDVIASSVEGKEYFMNIDSNQLLAIFYSLLQAAKKEEEDILRSGVPLRHYTDASRKMLWRELYGQGFQKE